MHLAHIVQKRPRLIELPPIKHAFDAWTKAFDLDELHHETVRRMKTGQLLRFGIPIHVQFADLSGVNQTVRRNTG